jgi:cell division protein FtsZ
VVATGLGGVMRQREPELRITSNHMRQNRVRRGAGPVNYSDLDTPPVTRRNVHAEEADEIVEAPKRAVGQSFDYRADPGVLDIPAFLRRQAD